jgi:hypothetical protein
MDLELLTELIHTLDSPQYRYSDLERYYTGTQPLSFLSPEAKVALGNRFGRMAVNIPRLAVTSLSERLRITGFTGADVWADWLRNDMDQRSSIAMREALLFGWSFVTVWVDAGGRPLVSVESPKQVAAVTDPSSRVVTSAIKRWQTRSTTELVIYLPDVIIRMRADTPGAATAGFYVVGSTPNPLGMIPVVPVRNSDLIGVWNPTETGATDRGCSEIEDLKCLCDGLSKTLADLAVAQEFTARPRRWATGIELVRRPLTDDDGNPVLGDDDQPVLETVNPIPEGNRAMLAENEQAKFGQLDGANLAGFQTAVDIWVQMIMAVSALPAHMIGITSANPPTAASQLAAEASLTARAEQRQQVFGRSWEQVGRLIVAVRDGADPAEVDCQVQWAPADSRSVAAEADSAQKLYAAGILSRTTTLKRLGFTDDEIAAELHNLAAESRLSTPTPNGPHSGPETPRNENQ